MATTLPAGSATENADVVNTAAIAKAFFFFADVMSGVDDQPRMEPGMSDGQHLGPAQSFGVDIGIDNAGNPYVRGRPSAGETGNDISGKPVQPATAAKADAAAFTMTPLMWVGIAFAAWKMLT